MGGGPAVLGPALYEGMGEPAHIAALNSWGAGMHREVLAIRADLTATQASVSGAFVQAEGAVREIVAAFRTEVAAMRQTTLYEAQQSLARLEQVVTEARTRFDDQDARFSAGLAELAGRLQAADTWAQAEPARIAAVVAQRPSTPPATAPATGWLTPPGMTSPALATNLAAVRAALATSPGLTAAAAGSWDAYTGPGPAPPDAWAAAAARQAAGQPPQAAPWLSPAAPPGVGWRQGPPHFDMSTPSGGGKGGLGKGDFGKGDFGGFGKGDFGKGGAPRELRINTRDWGDSRKLDVTTSFEGFQVWRDRATMYLSKERPDLRALLAWAETQSMDDLAANLDRHAAHLGIMDLASAEYAIHDGIKSIVVDLLLGRARNCPGRGCELWRALVAEWSGDAPQLRDVKARKCMDPPRCKDIAELWTRLPAWERLTEEVETSGFLLPEWMRRSALEKLLPTQLLSTLIARDDLKTYAVRLSWVKTQMEHTRGAMQAAAYGPGVGKDKDGDVYMNSVECAAPAAASAAPASCSEHAEVLCWAMAEAAQQGDWAQTEALQTAILALKGAKGTKGGNRKGLGKGKAGDKGAAAPAEFNGSCNHCGIWGHRKSECRRLNAELSAKGGGKNSKGDKGSGKGGKGGPKGGKGPLMELGEDDWNTEQPEYEGNEYDGGEWSFDTAIASLTPWTPAPVKRGRGGRTWRPFGAGTAGETRVQNAFSTLSLLAEDTEQNKFTHLNSLIDDATLIGAVAGEKRGGGTVVEAVVDSGAVHSVAPPGLFPGKVRPSPWSRAGRGYRAANGTGIKNLGQVAVPFATVEGHRCSIPFQVAEVEQPLLSVAHLTSAGNLVELGEKEGRVKNIATGRTIALERRGGVYILKMLIPEHAAPFGRQGA